MSLSFKNDQLCYKCNTNPKRVTYGDEEYCIACAFEHIKQDFGSLSEHGTPSKGSDLTEAQKASGGEEGHAAKDKRHYICEKCGHMGDI